MDCKRFHHILHQVFLDGITDEEMAELREHAGCCAPCGDLMAKAEALNCREFVEFLGEYLEDQLEPDRRSVFDRHLSICPDCRNYLASYRETMAQSKRALSEGEYAPESLPLELVRAILESRKRAP